jgi:uncharacterized membrane protein YbhN (UPF0104 family)
MQRKNTKSLIQFVVLLSIGILLIWLSIRKITPDEKLEIIHAFETANYFWIVVALVISFLGLLLRAYRWNYLLNPLGYQIGLLNATCQVIIGYFANYGIPRMGEISRCTLAAKYDKVPFEVGFGTVITERIIDFFLFLIIFFLTLAFQFSKLIHLANELIFDKVREKLSGVGENPGKLILLLTTLLLFIGLFFVIRKKFSALLRGKFGGIIKGMGEGVGSIRNMHNPFAFILLSLLIWACYFYSLYVCFFALKGTEHLGQRECLTLFLFGTFGVIFSPGGLGAYPAIVGGILLYTYQIDRADAFALPWLSWSSQFILIVITGVISLIILPLYNRDKNVVS